MITDVEPLAISSELKKISVAEKILIAEEIWDSIVKDPENFKLSGEQRNELDRRLAGYYSSPDDGYSWENIKNRIKNLKR